MRIVMLWLYKKYEDTNHFDILSKTYMPQVSYVRGDFEYYEIDGESARRVTRREADAYAKSIGEERVETIMGYPSFMHDQGYRV